jgi:hypothetical protein
MPPWTDVTLYDLAARNVLRGGVHYRDIFDTNLPGMVWCFAMIRQLVGPSSEGLRVMDLLVMGSSVVGLAIWLSRLGVPSVRVGWFVAALALFYPFLSEFNHVQRDGWMLLPVLLATWVRWHRLIRSEGHTGQTTFRWGTVGEGVLWGVGVWLKPHTCIPALVVVGVASIIVVRRSNWRTLVGDSIAVLGGGLLCGAAGVAWLVTTGAWPYFWDVMTRWVPGYLNYWQYDILFRFEYLFEVFGPWSALHALALPIAVYWLYRMTRGRSSSDASSAHLSSARGHLTLAYGGEPIGKALLAAVYVGWVLQVVVLQKPLDYVHVPPVFLALALLVAWGWDVGRIMVFAVLGGSLLLQVPCVSIWWQRAQSFPLLSRWTAHPLLDGQRTALWLRCWKEGSTPELRNRLGLYVHVHCATNWEELTQVAEYLRQVHPSLRDRELNCWHDSTHPLYLILKLEPATRYMHYGTAFSIRARVPEIVEEVTASPQRYVVSDLLPVLSDISQEGSPVPSSDPPQLPPHFPESYRQLFPWNQPLVFRWGRYCVHKVEPPLGVIDISP